MYLHLENSMFTASLGDPNSEVGFVRAVFNAACSLKIFIIVWKIEAILDFLIVYGHKIPS